MKAIKTLEDGLKEDTTINLVMTRCITKLRTSVLNTVKQGQILGRMSSNYINLKGGTKYDNRKWKIPNPPYVEKMLCLNIVICYHCREQIKLGDPYTRSGSGGGNGKITKYYHDSCFETMFY